MFFLKKKIIFYLLAICLFCISRNIVYSQTPTSVSDQDSSSSCIATQDCLDINIRDCGVCSEYWKKQKETKSSQIAITENQIKLTEYKIVVIKQQILDLVLDIDTATKKISTLQDSLNKITEVLLNRIVATYEAGSVQPLEMLLSSINASDLLTRLNYLKIAQAHDKRLIYDVQQAKNDYVNQKDIYEAKKKKVEDLKTQLEAYNVQLDQDKKTLQAQYNTAVEEFNRAIEQIAAFSRFTAAHGGASILSNQTVCDDGWSGCYYNQRDSQWGNLSLNNTQYTVASDGCLVTSMAMVYTHYSHRNVNPISINSNSDNFASYFPAYLKYTITADGATSTRVGSIIDNALASGEPVVVGVSYDGGSIPDHFVVLISGSGGNYKMNDPFTPNGHNISFTDHYSVSGIREIDKVNF
jgi:peptidoglycan hydrolase CwlO-like protein